MVTEGKSKEEVKLDEVLDKAYVEDIKHNLKPATLDNCSPNALIKSIQVSNKLKRYEDRKGPDEAEFTKLVDKLEDFTTTLLDPLKFDEELRSAFNASLKSVVDKAIDSEQKKVLTHPVIFNLLTLQWYGRFITLRQGKWVHVKYWEWLLLRFWTCIDVFIFPIMFFFLFFFHKANKVYRKRTGFKTLVFVTNSSEDSWQRKLICGAAKYVRKKLGRDPIICSFTGGDERDFSKQGGKPISFERHCLLSRNDTKLFVTFTSNKREVDSLLEIVKNSKPRIFPVALGLDTNLEKLRELARKQHKEYKNPKKHRNPVIHWCESEDSEKASDRLGKEIIHSIEGYDLYEVYLEYFTTPYFVFARDITSQLTLLGLHFYICLTPSQIPFSRVEWAILVFFLGKVASEIRQLLKAKSDNTPFSQLQRYFSDRWNFLDCITLGTYIVLFILRMYTWGTSLEVPFDRALAVSGYLYGLNAMFLTLRLFGHWMETTRGMGAIEIALFRIIGFLAAIVLQFVAVVLAFSLVISKVYITDRSYVNKKAGIEGSWWETVKFLAWSLLGIAELDPVTQVDEISTGLAYFLYGIFLILGGMLLLNMMIALLSNTYQQVEDNSHLEWTYKLAITIQTYATYDPVPVPLNLIFVVLKFVRRIICRHGKQMPVKKYKLDEVVGKLIKEYIETHGNRLPSADLNKSRVKVELKEIRRMTNQIASKVFHQSVVNQQNLPVFRQAWQSDYLTINDSQLTYDCDDGRYHGARHLFPFTQSFPKFEVLIQAETGKKRYLQVGIVWHSRDLHNLLSPDDETLLFDIDSGEMLPDQHSDDEGTRAYGGDLICCEIRFDESTPSCVPVLFTLNGHKIARRKMQRIENKDMFPYISMGHAGIQVFAKMCPLPSKGKSVRKIELYQSAV